MLQLPHQTPIKEASIIKEKAQNSLNQAKDAEDSLKPC